MSEALVELRLQVSKEGGGERRLEFCLGAELIANPFCLFDEVFYFLGVWVGGGSLQKELT